MKEFILKNKTTLIIVSSVLAVIIAGLIIFNAVYIPPCDSNSVLKQIKNEVLNDIGNDTTISFDKEKIKTIKKTNKKYECVVPVIINDIESSIHYKYSKGNFEYNFNLPDCYSEIAKNLVEDAVRERAVEHDGEDRLKSVELEYITCDTSKKKIYDAEKIECSATLKQTLKAGWTWNWNNKETKEEKLNYTLYFCNNEYTTCMKSGGMHD